MGAPRPAEAGAWTRTFLDYYVKVGADFYKAATYVDPSTGQSYDDDFFGQQNSVYGEHGVVPGLPVQVSMLLPMSVGGRRFCSAHF